MHTDGRGNLVPMIAESEVGTPAGASHDEYEVHIDDLLRVVWRRLWMILLVAAVLTGSVVVFDLWRMPIYEASISILIGQEQVEDTPSNLSGNVQGLQQITQTMSEAVETRPVAEEVVRRLDLEQTPEELLENLNVERIAETQFIRVSYENSSPQEAQRTVNTLGTVFSEQVSEISASANAVTATVWEEAPVPESPTSPNPFRDGLLALVLGGILGVGLAFLLENLDDSWRSPEEVEQVSGVPTFGVIPEFKVSKSKKGGG